MSRIATRLRDVPGLIRGVLVPQSVRAQSIPVERHGLLYLDQRTRRLRLRKPSGADVDLERPSPRFLPVSDVVSILASSSNTHFERHPLLPGVIRLKGRPFGTIADAIASAPTTWALSTGSKLTSASASGDSVTMTHNGASTGMVYNGTNTAPAYKRSFSAPGAGCVHVRIFHLAASTLSGTSTSVYGGVLDSNVKWIARFDLFNVAGTINLRYIINDTTSANITTRTAPQASTGTWCKIVVDEVKKQSSLWYYHGSYASGPPTLPASWTQAIVSSSTGWPNTGTFSDCFGVERQAANTAPVGIVSGWTTYREPSLSIPSGGLQDNWCSIGFASSSDAITLGVWDFGSAGGLPDITTMRLLLADAVNRQLGDAATWTFSLTGSSSAAPAAATTYQAAASLNLKAAGSDTLQSTPLRYWTLRAICASSGSTQSGSLDLTRIPGVVAAAA